MAKRIVLLTGVAALSSLLAVGAASAQAQAVRHHRVVHVVSTVTPPPVTVQKRSFLDPGNVVPVGSDTPEYVAANTFEHQPIYHSYDTAFFGQSELPGPFDLPNNPRFFPRQNLDFSPF